MSLPKTEEKDVKKAGSKVPDNNKKEIGPGYYEPPQSGFNRSSPSFSKGIACFGSKESRFTRKNLKSAKFMTPGPQHYQKGAHKSSDSEVIPKKKVPFGSSTNKDFQYFGTFNTCGLTNIAPGSYNPKTDVFF